MEDPNQTPIKLNSQLAMTLDSQLNKETLNQESALTGSPKNHVSVKFEIEDFNEREHIDESGLNFNPVQAYDAY